jgi:hypothetical protein
MHLVVEDVSDLTGILKRISDIDAQFRCGPAGVAAR